MSENEKLEYDIMLMRLASGDEIICKAIQVDKHIYQVVSPIGLKAFPDKTSGVTVQFVPLMLSAENNTWLVMANQIQAIAVPNKSMLDNYLIAIGEKPDIITPNTEIIIPKK